MTVDTADATAAGELEHALRRLDPSPLPEASPSPEDLPKIYESPEACEDRETFWAKGWAGDCTTFAAGQPNDGYCVAAGAVRRCSECGACYDPPPQPNPPPLPPLPPPLPPLPPQPPLSPGQHYVQPGVGTLQAAHDAASDGAELLLLDGVHTGSGDSVLEIGKSITIRAANAGQAVLDGEGERPVIKITDADSTIVLEGLNITKGELNGIVMDGGDVTLQGANIYSNGDGITVRGGTFAADGCTISSNQGFGITINHAAATAYSTYSYGNSYAGYPGMYYTDYIQAGATVEVPTQVAITDCSICSNWGGAYIVSGNVNITGTNISSNLGHGGILTDTRFHPRYLIAVDGCTISFNEAVAGGGIFFSGGRMTVANTNIHSNKAGRFHSTSYSYGAGMPTYMSYGEGREAWPDLYSLSGLTSASECCFGGGIALGNGGSTVPGEDSLSLTVEATNITNNIAQRSGGGIEIHRGDIRMTTTVFTGNEAPIGSNVQPTGGTIYYALPTPPGHWLPNSKCLVYREWCNPQEEAGTDPCANVAACTMTPGANVEAMGAPCKPPTLIQPCDWATFPEFIGQEIYTAPLLPIDMPFPNTCAAGYLGSNESVYQTSSDCAGRCPAGFYCPTAPTLEPVDCPAGSYCIEGSAEARDCPSGTYSSAANLASEDGCIGCLAGSFCPVGSLEPRPCGLGEFCTEGVAFGTRCAPPHAPELTTTLGLGAARAEDCVCKSGYFMKPAFDDVVDEDHVQSAWAAPLAGSLSCVECPLNGVDCGDPGVSLEALAIKPGYWRSHTLALPRQCFHAEFCVGTVNATEPARRRLASDATLAWSEGCAEHHTGPYCELCVTDFIMTAGGCVECTGSTSLLFIFPGAILALAILLAIYVCRTGRGRVVATAASAAASSAFEVSRGAEQGSSTSTASDKLSATPHENSEPPATEANSRWGCSPKRTESFHVKFRIVVSLVQVVSQLGVVFSIPYPPVYNDLVNMLGVFSLDLLQMLPLGCAVAGITHGHYLLIRTLVPLAILLSSLLVGRFMKADKRDKLLTCNFVLFYLLFPSNSAKIFATFGCETLDDPDETTFLLIDKSVDCKSPFHQSIQIYAFVMVLIYPIGIPAMYTYLLFFKHGKELRLLRSLELKQESLRKDALNDARLKKTRSAAEGRSHAETVDEIPAEVQAKITKLKEEEEEKRAALPDYVQKLVLGYELRTFDFELIECLRKLAIVCLPVFFQTSGSVSQLIFGLLMCLLTYGALTLWRPYVEDGDNRLAQLCQIQIFFALLSSIALKYDAGTLADSSNMGTLLVVLTLLPIVMGFLLETGLVSLCSDAVSASRRRSRLNRKPSRVVPTVDRERSTNDAESSGRSD